MTIPALFEASLMEDLTGCVGVPFYRWMGETEGRMTLATDPYGSNLEELLQFSGRDFNMQGIAFIAEQMISRLECIHSRFFVHGKLTPFSFAAGHCNWQQTQILLVDFSSVSLCD